MHARLLQMGIARVGAVMVLAGALGCATTDVKTKAQDLGGQPRPERVVVHRFAVSPDEVRLDHSVTAAAAWKLKGVPEATERKEVGRAVSDALADELVKKIQALGLPAERGDGPLVDDGRPTLVIDGQFLSINQGSRGERVAIGLGAGRSEVRTAVQVFELIDGGRRLLDQFEVDARSGAKPGMAETMGAGAAAGTVGQAAVVGVVSTAGSEAFGDDVEADAHRTADKLARALGTLFAREGWIAGER
jgi:hypothetical protein